MSLRHKQLQEITEADLRGLVHSEASEGREIEYKQQLPGTSDRQKREFLADVTSFANCIGGDLVLGIRADQGIAVDIPGIQDQDLDAEKLRLENLMRDGIRPRVIPSVTIHSIP